MEIKTDNDLIQLHELYKTVINMDANGSGVLTEVILLMKRFIIEQMYENDVDVRKMKMLCGVSTIGCTYDRNSALCGLGLLFEHYLLSRKVSPALLLGCMASSLLKEIYENGVDLKKMKQILDYAISQKKIEMAVKN